MNNLRNLLPALENKRYFNYGGQGPLPTPSLNAITKSWQKIQILGPFTNNVWPYIAKEVDITKAYLAKLCHIKKSQVALTENVTSGCILPLWGLPFSQADRILISDCEHPGVVAACKELCRREGLFIDVLPVQQLRHGINEQCITNEILIKTLDKHLTPKTKLVVLSHLLWNTGQIMPIELVSDHLALHPKQPFLLVDAAQSFGQIPIGAAASKADIYALTGHKWALGPEGLGAVILSERVLESSKPTFIGWRSLKKEGSIHENQIDPFHQDGRRFEIATSCIPLLAGLRCSLDLLEEEGSDEERAIKTRALSLSLWERLQGLSNLKCILNGPPPAGLVSFSISNNLSPHSIVKNLGNLNLWIRALEDPIWLRACLHITSQENEIIELIEALQTMSNDSK